MAFSKIIIRVFFFELLEFPLLFLYLLLREFYLFAHHLSYVILVASIVDEVVILIAWDLLDLTDRDAMALP